MSNWNVLIVDDHPLMRRGISQLLSYEEEFTDISEASNGADAVTLACKNEPDLILLDLNMKGMSGLDTLKVLREEGVTSTVIVLTVSDNSQDIRALIEAGADGYLLKDTEPDELVELLKKAMDTGSAYSQVVLDVMRDQSKTDDMFSSLTEREKEILVEVARGYSNRQIAERLFISEATVKVHIKSLLKKLRVKSRVAATVLYLESQGKA
ncbi:DNA-binding response regulator [Vibrio sp. MACH09]|uniref:response regulator n=1 Tax=unclassified Vibrio TaxID=2614977 RepID=UPI001493CDCF|nr:MULTISPECIES: response regulator [unclassified Vibrio]NOI66856.1 response regulator [Vibrio sp. 99-8-1]GLO62934.1 DNA-binding response regulator [Vibrio sp. MACH09]